MTVDQLTQPFYVAQWYQKTQRIGSCVIPAGFFDNGIHYTSEAEAAHALRNIRTRTQTRVVAFHWEQDPEHPRHRIAVQDWVHEL